MIRSVAIAEACCTGDVWIISRVFVTKKYRDSGFGRIVTKEVLYLIREKGVKEVFITPGGYPEYPVKVRIRFYENLGFVKTKSRTKKYIYGSYVKTFERE
jgi:GNAT superfamily N-acetyltransferase